MIIFDGSAYAQKKEEELKTKVSKLKFTPKLASILVGDDPASVLYTNLKKKAAEKIGIEFQVLRIKHHASKNEILSKIKELNKDETVHGIMVQLPLPKDLHNTKYLILNTISPEKDVDGLTKASPYMPATTKAVLRILKSAKEKVNLGKERVVVMGSRGMVGKSVIKELKNLKYKVIGLDIGSRSFRNETLKANILISATGKPNLIKEDMVKEGVTLIDVGSPQGDIDKSVYEKAAFITPVPGGVGPVTIVSLLENLVQSLYNSL